MPTAPTIREFQENNTVVSLDGTPVEFRSLGSGPGIIVIPGVLAAADDYANFAHALSERFTVHVIQRRGRGGSGEQGERYSIDRESEDVAAVQAQTTSRFLVGHSYGGLIALQVARSNTAFTRIAVYEPGVSVHGLIPMSWVPRYEHSLANRRYLDALATFSVATGPVQARRMPVWMMKPMLLVALRPRRRHSMYSLLAANLREHQEVARLNDTTADYREVTAPTLLMFGGRSRLDYVPAGIEALSTVLPVSTRHEFSNLDHFGPDRTGPRDVARTVADYFTK